MRCVFCLFFFFLFFSLFFFFFSGNNAWMLMTKTDVFPCLGLAGVMQSSQCHSGSVMIF